MWSRHFPFTKHFQKLWWKDPLGEEYSSIDTSSIHSQLLLKSKMVAPISPCTAWDWWILVKLVDGTCISTRIVSNGKTGLYIFKLPIAAVSLGIFQLNVWNMFHWHPNPNLLGNWKAPNIPLSTTSFLSLLM